MRQRKLRRAILLVGSLSGREGKAQIVGCRDAGVEHTDDHEEHRSAVDCGGEGIELAEEAAGEGDPDQRDEEEDEQAPRAAASGR